MNIKGTIYKRSNGFYQFTQENGQPFGVGPDMPDLLSEVKAYADAHPDQVEQHHDELPNAINSMIDRQRQSAYVAEADPLFFKYQRGDATEKEWLDKIAEIKSRFPKV